MEGEGYFQACEVLLMKKLWVIGLALILVACGLGNPQTGSDESIMFSVDARENSEYVEFVLTIQNQSDQQVELVFPSSQKYEIVVSNSEGEEVYRYSNGRMFAQAVQQETLAPSNYMVFTERWNYMYDGERVPKGQYTVAATLKGKVKGNTDQLIAEEKMEVPEIHPSFRQVTIQENDQKFVVTGEMKTEGSSIRYVVEDGHYEFINQTEPVQNCISWTEFSIEIEKADINSDRPLTLLLYSEETKEPYIIPLKP